MEDWKTAIIEALEETGPDANLTNDIYPFFEKKYSDLLPRTWKAVIRNYLERNSSDSDSWNEKNDFFHLKEKGSGIWSLKDPSVAKSKKKSLTNIEKIVLEKKPLFKELESLSIRTSNKVPKYKDTKIDLPSGKKFERGVWQLFFNMGAKVFNNEKELTFDLSSGKKTDQNSKQIDNFFIMRDKYVFIIECKETLRKNGRSATNLITQNMSSWRHLKKPIEARFKKIFKGIPGFKVMHVIATNGYNWTDENIEYLEKEGFLLLRQEEIEYFSGCFANSGSGWFTFNQFLATFRKNKDDYSILGHKEVVAIRTRKDFNEVLDDEIKDDNSFSYVYTSSMKVKDLIRISSVSHHSALKIYNLGNEIKSSYQRILKKNRLNRKTGIPAFIENTNKPFINNLLINYKGDVPLWKQFDGKGTLGEGRGGILKFQSMSPGMFHLIDGQHRLFGYSPLFEDDENSEYGEHELIVTIFDNLPPEEESRLFLHINTEQQGIARTLIIEIEQLSGVHAISKRQQLQNLSKSIIDHFLDEKINPNSPFINPKAIKGTQKSIDVYGNTIVEGKLTPQGVMKHMQSSPLLSISDNDFRTGLGYVDGIDLTDEYVNTIKNIKNIYIDYFKKIKDANPDLWIKKTKDGKEISNDKQMASNIPIGGLQILLDKFIELSNVSKGKDISKAISPYLLQLTNGLRKITKKDKDDMFNAGFYGGGAPKQFYFTLLEKFFQDHISTALQKEIDQDKKKHNQKAIVYIKDEALIKENEQLKKQLKEKDLGRQALAFRKLVADNLDPFFKKLFGSDYWDDIFANETDKNVTKAVDKSRQEYLKRANKPVVKNNKKEKEKVKNRPKILWIEWVYWKYLLSFVYKKSSSSEDLEEYLTDEFKNSDKFINEYDGKISEVIRDIFFIAKNKNIHDTNIALKWMEILPEIRVLASHDDEYVSVTPEEEEEFINIRDDIFEVARKLADFSIN